MSSRYKTMFKGHNSFYLRDSWLSKVLLEDDLSFLHDNLEISYQLGIGTGMSKSLKYYLQTAGLVKKQKDIFIKLPLYNTLSKYDPYMNNNFSKIILHYHFIINKSKATSFNIFFNDVEFSEIAKEDLLALILNKAKLIDESRKIPVSSIESDVSVLSRMYFHKDENDLLPEDNLKSPLSDLGLIRVEDNVILKKPLKNYLNELHAIMYIIVSEINKETDDQYYVCDFEDLSNGENNIGKILNLDKFQINEVISKLEQNKYIFVQETAGLNQIYIDKGITEEAIIQRYYNGEQ